jgi:hypothetical protein
MLCAVATMVLGSYTALHFIEWRNPRFKCPALDLVEFGHDLADNYPFPIRIHPWSTPTERSSTTVADFEAFCSRMEERFASSNMSYKQAYWLHSLLVKMNNQDIPSGTRLLLYNSGAGAPAQRPGKFAIEKQLQLKHVRDDEYEIFFWSTGCGINYAHQRLRLQRDQLVEVTRLEAWSESVAC